MKGHGISVVMIGLLLAVGCSAENAGTEPWQPAVGGPGLGAAGGVAEGAAQPGSGCAPDNQTQPCFCQTDEGPVEGRQVCSIYSGWGPCECAQAPETLVSRRGGVDLEQSALNKGPERFDWERTPPGGASCQSGHYEGGFDGFYLSAATWGWGTIPVAGNVAFDLGESSTGEYYTVSNGFMQGVALGMFPFEGEIVGDLDCNQAYFDGLMVNCRYIVGVIPYSFQGLLRSKYDKFNHAFVRGLWSVTEPAADGTYPDPPDIEPGNPPPAPWPAGVCGGTGNWSATWKP